MPLLSLAQILFSQGFGSRRDCQALILSGRVELAGVVCLRPDARVATEDLVFTVDGADWPYHERALVMLNKPAGYECSRRPSHRPSVLALLPAPLRARGVQPVGRLDADSTGLLLLTDDGALLHRLTAPKWHLPKLYLATCAEPVRAEQIERLRAGVVLRDDPAPVRAQAVERIDSHRLSLTLTEGRYHQVRRMVAAAGNHVSALHRSRFGALDLPADLAPGQWRFLRSARAVLGQ